MAKKPTLTVQLMHKQRELDTALFQLNQARMDIQSLEAEVKGLLAEWPEPRRVEAEPEVEVPAPAPVVPRTPYVRPARHVPAHFAAARELAMRLGKCVKVSA